MEEWNFLKGGRTKSESEERGFYLLKKDVSRLTQGHNDYKENDFAWGPPHRATRKWRCYDVCLVRCATRDEVSLPQIVH